MSAYRQTPPGSPTVGDLVSPGTRLRLCGWAAAITCDAVAMSVWEYPPEHMPGEPASAPMLSAWCVEWVTADDYAAGRTGDEHRRAARCVVADGGWLVSFLASVDGCIEIADVPAAVRPTACAESPQAVGRGGQLEMML